MSPLSANIIPEGRQTRRIPGSGYRPDAFLSLKFQDGLSGAAHQRLAAQGAREQIQRLSGFTQATLGEAAFVQGVAPDQVLAKRTRGPLAELRTPQGLDAITNGNDDVKVEVLDLSQDGASHLASNCCKFCKGCLPLQLSLAVDVADVPTDNQEITVEECGHLP